MKNNKEHTKFIPKQTATTDIVEQKNEVNLILEMAGVDKKDAQINLQKNYLSVEGLVKLKNEVVKKFVRNFKISSEYYNLQKIQAKIQNGILKITIPKSKVELEKKIIIQ